MTITQDQSLKDLLRASMERIQALTAERDALRVPVSEPIAVIGVGMRLPGASTLDELWEMTSSASSGLGAYPASRLADVPGGFFGEPPRGGFLPEVDGFDAAFFGVSPREAAFMDPQQRILLEVMWHALEDAGVRPKNLRGQRVGIYTGVTNDDYMQAMLEQTDASDLEAYALTGGASTFAAGRLAYWLGVHGPSLSVDTACSSSLLAVHLAVQALRAGDCDMAVASGVNVLLSPKWYEVLAKANMLSPDWKCHSFDDQANGYVRSEGCGAVALKTLAQAQRDSDRVLAVLHGSAANQDGRASGITVPNGLAQEDVITAALADAGVEPEAVGYVEAHGTGTPLGDPIELGALSRAYCSSGRTTPLAVGALKANIGHLEPAAGIAGLLHAIALVRAGQIPPIAGLASVNADVDTEELLLHLPTEVSDWEGETRYAGVSSFGASGTNVHVIVGEAPLADALRTGTEADAEAERGSSWPTVLPVSAETDTALAARVRHVAELSTRPDVRPQDLAHTLATKGDVWSRRRAFVIESESVVEESLIQGFRDGDGVTAHRSPRVAMGFTGQGSQYPGMGASLYAASPAFRSSIDVCAKILREHLDTPLTDLLFDPVSERLNSTDVTQPAMVALQWALTQHWESWGVTPDVVLGHSVGEIAAAATVGALSIESALHLAAARGALMERLTGAGRMAAVRAPRERVEEVLAGRGDVVIAAVNGPDQVVISGSGPGVEDVLADLDRQAIRAKALPTTRAFHSPLMLPMVSEFDDVLAGVDFMKPAIPMISALTGQLLGADEFNADYLSRHVMERVDFLGAAKTLMSEYPDVAAVEIGPGKAVLGMLGSVRPADDAGVLVASLRKGESDCHTLASGGAQLWEHGVDVDFQHLCGDGRQVTIAGYPFDRRRFWYTPTARNEAPASHTPVAGHLGATAAIAPQPLGILGQRVPTADGATFISDLDERTDPCLVDCVMGGTPIVNVGFMIESFLAAASHAAGSRVARLKDLTVSQRLTFEPGRTRRVATTVTSSGDSLELTYSSAPEDTSGPWARHAKTMATTTVGEPLQLETPESFDVSMDGSEFYRGMWRRQLYLGDGARWVEGIEFNESFARARMRAATPHEVTRYRAIPGLLDALFQVLFAPVSVRDQSKSYMVVSIDELSVRESATRGASTALAFLRPSRSDRFLVADVVLVDDNGEQLITASGVTLARADAPAPPTRSQGERDSAAAWDVIPHGSQTSASPTSSSLASVDEEELSTEAVLVDTLATALRCAPSDIDPSRAPQQLGLDSLMAMEVRDELQKKLGVAVSLSDLLEASSVTGLARTLTPASVLEPDTADTSAAVEEPARPAEGDEQFPLTDLQQAYLVGRDPEMEMGGVPTFFSMTVDLPGLDRDLFERALNDCVRAHDMLRAVMTDDGHQQVLDEVPDFQVIHEDLSALDADEVDAATSACAAARAAEVSDPGTWPLFTFTTCELPGGATRLLVGIDALIIDAWSTALLFDEIARRYRGETVDSPTYSFKDYVSQELADRSGAEYARDLTFWEERLSDLPPGPDLPVLNPRGVQGPPLFEHLEARLSHEEWVALCDSAKRHGVTPSSALCAAYAEVLATWSASPHFALTLLFFNRRPYHADVARVLGNFSSTTILEIDFSSPNSFASHATAVQRQLWLDLEHSRVSGIEVLRRAAACRGQATVSVPVVFASTINFMSGDGPAAGGLTAPLVNLVEGGLEVSSSITTPQVWLDHQVVEDASGVRLNWDYVADVLPKDLVTAMFEAYVELVTELASSADAWDQPADPRLRPVELEGRQRANDTVVERPHGRRLQDDLLEAARRTPDAPAVITADAEVTFRELVDRADEVAVSIRESGRPAELVGVLLPKGAAQIAATLAILNAGGAYVPLAWDSPAARIEAIVRQAGLSLVITTQSRLDDVAAAGAHGVDVEAVSTYEGDALRSERSADELAYVIFTSGSTGTPKGVMIEHQAALCTIDDVNSRYGVSQGDRVFGVSALNFDLSVWDIFGVLGAGGTLVLPGDQEHLDPRAWADLCESTGVTVWNSVPALAQLLAETLAAEERTLDAIRLVMMSGDWIPLELPALLRDTLPHSSLHSLGGATEAAIWSISHPIERVDPDWASIPYGRPLTNQTFHVLDSRLRDRPVGVAGDLYIGGAGLARGYLADPERSAASFIDTPRGRLYRTGDLGRYTADGTIEFLGRTDGQVKIQGHRIELGEVEAALASHPSVSAAVAAAAGQQGGVRTLVAAVVASADVDTEHVLEHVSQVLPRYMVPTRIGVIESVPLSANGKVDRSAITGIVGPRAAGTGRKPRTAAEERLLGLWSDVLGSAVSTIDDDFFAHGGNSLLGMRLMSSIRRQFGVRLPVASLFTTPTVAGLAALLGTTHHERETSVELGSGSGGPSFWFHPVGGDVFCYSAVARDLDAPLIGIQCGDGEFADLKELVAHYTAAVLAKADPGVPIRLAGWSMGGLLALEVARDVRSRGIEVAPVLAVDLVEHPDGGGGPAPADRELVSWFATDVARISGAPLPDPLPATATELPAALRGCGALAHDIHDDDVLELFGRFTRNAKLLAAHVMEPAPIQAVFVRGSDGAAEGITRAWADRVDAAEIVELDGDHYSVMSGNTQELVALAASTWALAGMRTHAEVGPTS